MQVSDLVGQYHNASARPEMTGTKGIQKLVSTLRDMKSGNIFEGTVNSVKGQKVTLALPNGQEITARMDGKVKLIIGQSMFFQVKGNDGMQISIRPYTVEGNSMNLTLMEALKAANIAVDGRNLSMVNAMMEEQLSIDRSSLSQMNRIVQSHPDIDVKTLVQMKKLELPITPETASQFQNYLEDKQAIGKALSEFIETFPTVLTNENMSTQQLIQSTSDVITIVTENLPAQPLHLSMQTDSEQTQSIQIIPESDEEATVQMQQSDGMGHKAVEVNQGTDILLEGVQLQLSDAAQNESLTMGAKLPLEVQIRQVLHPNVGSGEAAAMEHTLAGVLTEDELTNLQNELQQFPELLQKEGLFSEGKLVPHASSVALLQAIKEQIPFLGAHSEKLMSLVSLKEFQALIKDAMEQQWSIQPKEIKGREEIGKLYEKIENQLERLENVVKATGQNTEQVSLMASDIRSNVSFMEQINQIYTYVQIPLKMTEQNASGELYVYTNKKKILDENEELSAFLHLDMDHLGSTDVSIKLKQKNVSANFYFEDDESFSLISKFAPVLEERLNAKGYHCNISVKNEQQHVNFVEDFLKKDQPSAGLVHRYSFDMRA